MLAGRDDLLATLHDLLTGDGPDGPRMAALHGMGGAGKTSVAVEYAYRHLATAGIVWQFPAEDRAVLAAEFARLAAQLGASGGLLDPRDPVASVHAVLAASPAPWLLVFDNAPDQESARAFLPPAGNGQILITSQSALWPPGLALELPVLRTEIAAGFLTARTGDPDVHAATELAVQLDGLPLALEQAAAYIQATGGSLAGYLGLFRERRGELLAKPTGRGQTVTATWALAFSRLEQDAPQAAGLLRLLACCAPEPVPLRLLLRPRDGIDQLDRDVTTALNPLLGDALAVGDAIAALRRYSLIVPDSAGSVLVHRLVQAVTLGQMPDNLAAAWRQAAAALIEDAIPADTDPPESWPACAALLPHARAALAASSGGIGRIANYLGASGSYAAALDVWRAVTEAREHLLGPEHPETLSARQDLAHWTGETGDPAAARDQFAGLLAAREQVLGREHPETLETRHSLAEWTGKTGDPAAARDQFAGLLAAREQVLGREHRDILDTRSNLAYWTGEAGDPAAARDQFAGLLPVCEQVLGPTHPDTLANRGGLAYSTGVAGNPAAARDQFARLLPAREQVLGPAHPETLETRHSLAEWTGKTGDPAAARDQFAALLPAREQLLGPMHPDTMSARASLAYWTRRAEGSD
jgi:Tetratricopeptide repeat